MRVLRDMSTALSTLCAALAIVPGPGIVEGEVTYRERVALPKDAMVTVKLLDVCDPTRPAVIAKTNFVTKGRQVPFPFKLSFEKLPLRPDGKYAVKAQISSQRSVLFLTMAPVPELGVGKSEPLLLVLKRFVQPGLIEGRTWTLVKLNGRPLATEGIGQSTLTLEPSNGRMSGSGGVNRISGDYKIGKKSLTFGAVVSTLMAGPETLMEQERLFMKALEETSSFFRRNGNLVLTGRGVDLAEFTARTGTQGG